MMGILIILVFLVMWMGSSISGSWNDQNQTFKSRDNSKMAGRLTYDKYSKNGRVRHQVWAATGQKGHVSYDGKFIDTRGRVVADIKQMQVDRANQVSMILSKQKGWDFYPYFVVLDHLSCGTPWGPMYINDTYSWSCKEISTERTFNWLELEDHYIRSYCVLDNRGRKDRAKSKDYDFGGRIERQGKYKSGFIKEINDIATVAWKSGIDVRA